MQRQSKLLQDMAAKEKAWKERVEQLSVENTTATSDHVETIRQLTQQNESITQTFKVGYSLVFSVSSTSEINYEYFVKPFCPCLYKFHKFLITAIELIAALYQYVSMYYTDVNFSLK